MLFNSAFAESSDEQKINNLSEIVSVTCSRSLKSYATCSARKGIIHFDTVYGSGKTFSLACKDAEKNCIGKEECNIIKCVNVDSSINIKGIYKLLCDCFYQLPNYKCGSVGEVESIGVGGYWGPLSVNGAESLCRSKFKEQNIPNNASLFLHNCLFFSSR